MVENGPKLVTVPLLRVHFEVEVNAGLRNIESLAKLALDSKSIQHQEELLNSIDAEVAKTRLSLKMLK